MNKALEKKIREILLEVHDKDCYRGTSCGHIEDGVSDFESLITAREEQLVERMIKMPCYYDNPRTKVMIYLEEAIQLIREGEDK